jgi:hypothetical protein
VASSSTRAAGRSPEVWPRAGQEDWIGFCLIRISIYIYTYVRYNIVWYTYWIGLMYIYICIYKNDIDM